MGSTTRPAATIITTARSAKEGLPFMESPRHGLRRQGSPLPEQAVQSLSQFVQRFLAGGYLDDCRRPRALLGDALDRADFCRTVFLEQVAQLVVRGFGRDVPDPKLQLGSFKSGSRRRRWRGAATLPSCPSCRASAW